MASLPLSFTYTWAWAPAHLSLHIRIPLAGKVFCPSTTLRAKPDLGSQLKETAACLGKFAELFKQVIKNWASLVAQWWEICLPVQETWV